MNVAVAGGTWATRNCIDGLRRNGLEPLVLGQRQKDSISGWVDLKPDGWFDSINDIRSRGGNTDYLFVVGCSEIVQSHILAMTEFVGFHPTALPKGRGRAPIAWLALGAVKGAATFFRMTDEVDAGPIYAQVPFQTSHKDYASDICVSICEAMDEALDEWLPNLGREPVPQDDRFASYLGVRKPEDGEINWGHNAYDIARLVRATSHPHPGAWTFSMSGKLTIWRASNPHLSWHGVPGRVLTLDGGPLVATGAGVIRIEDYDGPDLRVGEQLA